MPRATKNLLQPTAVKGGPAVEARVRPSLRSAVLHWLRQNAAALSVSFLLILATLAIYGQTLRFGFISYDDNDYVYENSRVKQGLTLDNVVWAFSHSHAANWHPLTTLSHMLDCSLYRLWPGGHHLTNVLLHAAASIALFLALRRLTGFTARSAVVAAFFCMHPLRVESVAWVSERKDVLSGVFFGLTLWAYARYVFDDPALSRRAGGPDTLSSFPWPRYLLVMLFFALGLLSKPMLVTVPFLLLLLDFWPLDRWNAASRRLLILEKLPLLLLSAASCTVTYLVQVSGSAVSETAPALLRLQTAVLGYARYLAMLIWPVGLAAPYPRDREFYAAATAMSAAALLAISAAVLIYCRKRYRFILVGWFWFLGMLVPVSGLVVIGDLAAADRYTYLPLTGLFIAIVWSAAELAPSRPVALAVAAGMLLAICAAMSIRQAGFWRNNEVFYRRALDVTRHNSLAHTNYGTLLMQQGKAAEGEEHFRAAMEFNPRNYIALSNLGLIERQRGNLKAAASYFLAALEIEPGFAPARAELAAVYAAQHRPADAQREAQAALANDRDCAPAEAVLATVLTYQKRYADALPHYRRAIQLGRDDAHLHKQYGIALFATGSTEQGIAECKRAVALDPFDADARRELADIYRRLGRQQESAEASVPALPGR